MAVEAMKALCCLVVGPLRQYEQTALSQDLEQPISADLESSVRLAMQQIVQLAGTQTGLAHSDLLYKLNHPVCLTFFAISGSVAFVVCLSTDA